MVPGMKRPRVVVADDHPIIADAFKRLLAADFDVVAIVHDGRRLIDAAREYKPDVITIDIGMPLLNGLQASIRIKRILPETKLVCVTVNQDTDLLQQAFRCGASAYLPKTAAGSELINAIERVLQGEEYISPLLLAANAIPPIEPVTDILEPHLTDRQFEVLQLLAEGKSMKEVGGVLNLTTRTVAFHKYRLMQALNLNNDAEIVRYAIRKRITFN